MSLVGISYYVWHIVAIVVAGSLWAFLIFWVARDLLEAHRARRNRRPGFIYDRSSERIGFTDNENARARVRDASGRTTRR